jgi:hypothetical protein
MDETRRDEIMNRRDAWQVWIGGRHVATVGLTWHELNAGAREFIGADELILDAYAKGTLTLPER